MPRLGGLASRYYNILITLSLLLPAPANPAKQHWPFDAVQRRASVRCVTHVAWGPRDEHIEALPELALPAR
jgi:hypothetical protein